MLLEKYSHSDRDPWVWSIATLEDVTDIVGMAEQHFQMEINQWFTPNPPLYARNVATAIVRQMYNIFHEQLLVARGREDRHLYAYTWVSRGAYVNYAVEEMAEVRFAHVDMSLSTRARVRLVAQMIQHWHLWAQKCSIPVVVSCSIREDQQAFLHLHTQAGFVLRGSIGYLKVIKETDVKSD